MEDTLTRDEWATPERFVMRQMTQRLDAQTERIVRLEMALEVAMQENAILRQRLAANE